MAIDVAAKHRSSGRVAPQVDPEPGRARSRRLASRRRLPPLRWNLAIVLFVGYATLAVRNHTRLHTSAFDLGIFDQAVRSYASGHLGITELEGPNYPLLGDHFSPIVASLAPLYRIFPSPVCLLLAQAALLAVAVVPLAGWAQRVAGRNAAIVVGVGYGCSWGIAETLGFDFHEVAFAVPLLAFSACAFGQGRYRAAVAWAAPLVLVKEDLGLTVAVLGGLIGWAGRRRLGAATLVAGLGASVLELKVLIPAASPAGLYQRSLLDSDGHSLFERLTVGLVTPEAKPTLLLLLLAPTAMLALRSPLVLLAVPTLAWRLTTDNPNYWGTQFHYSAVLMPILFAAFVDGLRRVRVDGGTRVRDSLTACALVTVVLLPAHPLWDLVRPSTWSDGPRIADAQAVLSRIPDNVRVAASNVLAPHLTSRDEVTAFGYALDRPNPEWLAVDLSPLSVWPFTDSAKVHQLVDAAVKLGYVPVDHRGDFVVLHRSPTDTRLFPPPQLVMR